MFTDSHAHITSLEGNVDEILMRAIAAGLSYIINIATNPDELETALVISKKHPWVFNAAATTPHDVEKSGELHFQAIEEKAKKGELVALGETGLDYYYAHSPKEIQKHFLKRYLNLATKLQLPVIFHCRNAFEDLFSITDEIYKGPALLHCFTGTMEEAEKVIERGWHLSLSGVVTYKKNIDLQEIAKKVPLNRLMIETDAPYLAPQSKRGKQNEPAYILETAACIAELKGIPIEQLAKETTNNALQFFKINLK